MGPAQFGPGTHCYYARTACASAIADFTLEPPLSSRISGVDQESSSSDVRRHTPERPPVFSHNASSPMVIDRSEDLHMS